LGRQNNELSSSGALNRSEVYVGGRHLATYTAGTTYFDHADWLGTERARSGVSGVVCETVASQMFGDGQVTSGSCGDPSPLHFTGKQRDTESGLDDFDARYYSSTLGRFISADWSAVPEPVPYAHLSNPQTLNLYAIVGDNVESFADLDGHDYDIQGVCSCTVGTYTQVLQMVALEMPGAVVKGDQVRGEITFDGAVIGSYTYCDPGKCTQKAATAEELAKAHIAAMFQLLYVLTKDVKVGVSGTAGVVSVDNEGHVSVEADAPSIGGSVDISTGGPKKADKVIGTVGMGLSKHLGIDTTVVRDANGKVKFRGANIHVGLSTNPTSPIHAGTELGVKALRNGPPRGGADDWKWALRTSAATRSPLD